MIVTCPECATRYAVDDAAFKSGGRAVRCAHCTCEWYQIGSNTPTDRASDPSAFPLSIDQDAPAAPSDELPERVVREPHTARGSHVPSGPRSASEHLQAARRSLAGGAVDARAVGSAAGATRSEGDDDFFAGEDELERARAALGVASAPRNEPRRNGVSGLSDRSVSSDRISPPEHWRSGSAGLDGATARAMDDDLFEDVPETSADMAPEPRALREAFSFEGRRADGVLAKRTGDRSGAFDDNRFPDDVFRDDAPGHGYSDDGLEDDVQKQDHDQDYRREDGDMVDGFDSYDRAYTPAVAAAARRETARAGGVSYRTTAFGRSDGALRRPTRSRRRPVASERSEQAPAENEFSPAPRDGGLRRPAVEESTLFDPARSSGFSQDHMADSRSEAEMAPRSGRSGRGRSRGLTRMALAVSLVGGGLFAAYTLGPQFAEIAPVAAPTVEAYRDRVNAVFSNTPSAQPGRSSGLAFVDYQYDLVERAEGPALEVWGRVANNGSEPVLTPTIEIVSRNTEGEALQRWLAHPEVDRLGVGESARFTSRMMYPLGPVSDVDLYIAPR